MAENIKVFALGGLDEKGKNLYVIEVDDDIFVIEAGVKYPDRTQPGIDLIIADYQYLRENASRVKAFIISHGHCEMMGALPFMVNDIKAPIYCTKATKIAIEVFTKANCTKAVDFNFHVIGASESVMIANHKFRFFQTAHSTIDSCGFALETSMGSIVYTGEFIVEYNMYKNFKFDINKFAKIADNDVLLLISESSAAGNPGYTSPNHRLRPHLNRVFRETLGRTYVALFDKNIYGFMEVIMEAFSQNKKIIFYNEFAKDTFEHFLECSENFNSRLVIADADDILRMKQQDVVIVMVNQGENIFEEISELACGEVDDKRFIISPNDTFLIACPPVSGLEIQATNAIDDVYKTGAKIVNLKRKDYAAPNAREEDLKTMLSLLKPKYYLPVIGQYVNLLANANVAVNMGGVYNHKNVFILDNGMVLNIKDGVASMTSVVVPTGDLMIDGNGVGDVRDDVLTDRQKLSDNGVIIIAAAVSRANKKIIAGPDVQMRGFVFVKESEGVLKEISRIFVEKVTTSLRINSSMEDAKTEIVETCTKFVRKETGRDPMIVAIIEEL